MLKRANKEGRQSLWGFPRPEITWIDDADLDISINILNESIREQEELESRIRRAEWTSKNKDE